ncbi:MAG: hypothetical protein QXV32_07695 [Conexivisphaerales archaeon]
MNKKYATFALALSALVALSIFASLGNAVVLADSQDNEDAGKGSIDSLYHQHFSLGELSAEGNSAVFLSTSQSTSGNVMTRTLFGVFASAEDVPTLAVALMNETITGSGDGRNASFTWAVGGIKALGVFEYNDTAKTGVYNRSVDGQPLSQINFDEMDWTLNTKQVTLSNGVQGYLVNITGTKGSFVFGMSAVVYNTGVVVAGTQLLPTQVKVNFTIQNYPFVSSSSRLGLLLSYGGQQHFGSITNVITKTVTGSGEDQVETINRQTTATVSKGAFAYFYWNTNAVVDGVSQPVKSEQLSNGTFARIILNYPQGKSIVHDPILGAGTGLPSQIPTLPSLGGATSAMSLDLYLIAGSIVIIALVSALAIAARRKLIEPRLMM